METKTNIAQVIQVLLSNYWVDKSSNHKLYYEIKEVLDKVEYDFFDDLPAVKSFLQEDLGYKLIVDKRQEIIKLEKIPAEAQEKFGEINFKAPNSSSKSLRSKLDYILLALIMEYIEDIYIRSGQFILSELEDFLSHELAKEDFQNLKFDLTNQNTVYSFTRVIELLLSLDILKEVEGQTNTATRNEAQDVLYNITDRYQYFTNRLEKITPERWNQLDLHKIETQLKTTTKQRAYRKLILDTLVKKQKHPDIFQYIEQNNEGIAVNLQKFLNANLHLYSNYAVVSIKNEVNYSNVLPRSKKEMKLLLAVNDIIVEQSELENGYYYLSKSTFKNYLQRAREKFHDQLQTKYCLNTSLDELIKDLSFYINRYNLGVVKEDIVQLKPIIKLLKGERSKKNE